MQKPTTFVKSVEVWSVRDPKNSTGPKVQQVRIAVRSRDGRFHGATNFKTKV
jgi:hypothetical protein